MSNWKQIVADMLEPKEKLSSVIDTYLAIGQIIEAREKVVNGEFISVEDIDTIVLNSLFTLNFLPFFNTQGGALRPLFIMAIQSPNKTPLKDFFSEAIPFALTIAMPHRQKDYAQIRKTVVEKFNRT